MGYIAYKRGGINLKGRRAVTVIGNPVCAPRHLESLLGGFVRHHPRAAFYLIDYSIAAVLSRFGYFVNEFGVETILKLPYSLTGEQRAEIRLLLNRARAANVEIRELDRRARREYGITDEDISELIRSWLGTRSLNHREFTFLSRPFNYGDEPDCRKFFATCRGKLVGVGVFDPIFRSGRIEAYSEVIARTPRHSPKGTRDLMLFSALDKFAAEGVEYVSLGLSPLQGVREISPQAADLRRSTFTAQWLDFTYHRLNGIVLNFKGLGFKKGRYAGSVDESQSTVSKIYCGFPTRFPIAEMMRAGCLTANISTGRLALNALNFASLGLAAVREIVSR